MRLDARLGMALLILLSGAAPGAAQMAWSPTAGHVQIPIWPGVIPDARPVKGAEVAGTVVDAAGRPKLVGGKPWTYVDRVSQPTITVFSPATSNSGVAVVVFPGGGYNILAIDLEGTEVCTTGRYVPSPTVSVIAAGRVA